MKPESVGGLFTIVSKFDSIADPVVIGLTGKLTKEELTQEIIAHIKMFYNRGWCAHHYTEEFPEKFEPSYPAVLENFKNGFLILSPEEYKKYKLRRSGSALYPFKPRPYDDADYYAAEANINGSAGNEKYHWTIYYKRYYYDSLIGDYHEIVDKLEELNKEIKPKIIHN